MLGIFIFLVLLAGAYWFCWTCDKKRKAQYGVSISEIENLSGAGGGGFWKLCQFIAGIALVFFLLSLGSRWMH